MSTLLSKPMKRVGFCEQTVVGGDCALDRLGAWEGITSMPACAEKCRGCQKCRFVSFSREFGDCSWYSACDQIQTEIPYKPPGAGKSYFTLDVKPPLLSAEHLLSADEKSIVEGGHHDLEAPGALLAAARMLANERNELVFMVTGNDANSVRVLNSSLVTLETIGLRKHTLVIADSWETCEALLAPPCFWTSRTLRNKPAMSITIDKFWDWRFKFYHIKKRYMAMLVSWGFSVLQTDTDVVWVHDPFPVLKSIGSSVVVMGDGPIANAGVVFARPGSKAAIALLEDVAWRVQLFQFWPEYVRKVVPYAQPPYYANSDDQTILNDAIVSAVLGKRTFLGSTARFEAKNGYNHQAKTIWEGSAYAKEWEKLKHQAMARSYWRRLSVPWAAPNAPKQGFFSKKGGRAGREGSHRYQLFPFSLNASDSLAVAPRALFAHLPYSPDNAMTHLTAARGFNAKVQSLTSIGAWFPTGVGTWNPTDAAPVSR